MILKRRWNLERQIFLQSLRKKELLRLVICFFFFFRNINLRTCGGHLFPACNFVNLIKCYRISQPKQSHSIYDLQVFGKNTFVGLYIALFAGVCFSLFSPAFNLATNDQWHTLNKGAAKLVVYTAFFWFSLSCFVLAIILNITFLYCPVLNLPRSSVKSYLKDWNGRGWSFLAGLLCGLGNGLQFMAGEAAGYAAADAVQVSSVPHINVKWDDHLSKEVRWDNLGPFSKSQVQILCLKLEKEHFALEWALPGAKLPFIKFTFNIEKVGLICLLGSPKHPIFWRWFQALPLVSTFWGIVLFGEYQRSSRRTYVLLASMLLMFAVAVVILMASAGHRKMDIVTCPETLQKTDS